MKIQKSIDRRSFLKASGAASALGSLALAGCASSPASLNMQAGPKVVVIGAGYGGATAAKYIRLYDPSVNVTLVERNREFISCPISNLVLGGSKGMSDITMSYDALSKNHGIKLVFDEAIGIDVDKRQVKLAGGVTLDYDRLIIAPGIDFMYDAVPGLKSTDAQNQILHAWKAGPQTVALRKQLESMQDGGVFAISIPEAPYRCPPGPYERACQVAAYLKQAKPKSKVLILDANADVTSKPGLFKKAWTEMYAGMVEYRPNSKLQDVDVAGKRLKLEVEDVKADVLNVLPPMKAGKIADLFITANKRWCEIDWLTYESKAAKNVHLLGDALQIAPAMPKSGHMANAHGKQCAAAVVDLLAGREPNPEPTLTNTCYSFVSSDKVVHVASVHKYVAAEKTMKTVAGSGGVSASANELEGTYAMTWAKNIWADSLT